MPGICAQRKVVSALAISYLIASSIQLMASANDFSSDQRAALQQGRIVFIGESVPNYPWPRANIYRVVNASPLEVISVFFDYANASQYIPNLKQSKISKMLTPWKQEVYYEVKLPLLPNEAYIAQNTIQKQNTPDCYQISWTILKAKYFKSSEGYFQVKPYDANRSIIYYVNLADPGSQIAGCFRGVAQKQVEETVDAIANQVVRQKQTNPSDLQRQITSFKTALSALERK